MWSVACNVSSVGLYIDAFFSPGGLSVIEKTSFSSLGTLSICLQSDRFSSITCTSGLHLPQAHFSDMVTFRSLAMVHTRLEAEALA